MFFMSSRILVDFGIKWTAAILMIWVFDSIALLTKRIKRLSIVGDKLKMGNDLIDPKNDLLTIHRKRDERRGTTIRTLELEYLKNGMMVRQQTITKPVFGDFLGRRTRTIEILINEFPFLQDKVFGDA